MLKIIDSTDRRAMARLLHRRLARDRAVERRVARIVSDVRRQGDRAVRRYATRLDALDGSLEVGPDEMARGAGHVPREVRAALRAAARHIRTVAAGQVPRARSVRVAPGVTIEERVTPLGRVGCYVPAGRYPLPSSLLMTAVPARMAGVAEVIASSPVKPGWNVNMGSPVSMTFSSIFSL